MSKAIILCAGRGSRLGKLTQDIPKPLTKINKKTILDNSIEKLIEAEYREVVIVVGYKADQIKESMKKYEGKIEIRFIENKKWEKTNNIYSLWLAKSELNENVILMEGDIFLNLNIFKSLNFIDNVNRILVSPVNNLLEGFCALTYKNSNNIIGFDTTSTKNERSDIEFYKTINIHVLSQKTCRKLIDLLDNEIEKGNTNEYYEIVFESLLKDDELFEIVNISRNSWYEVDSLYDLKIAEFISSKEQYRLLKNQHGGYWRYPLLDFALIYNFNFPPKSFKSKITKRFDDILLNYPSNSYFIESYLADFLSVKQDYLMIANGVSEIIKILPQIIDEKVMLLKPSFNEYEECLPKELIINYYLKEENNFCLDLKDFIREIEDKKPSNIILISPDNPSGVLISKNSIKKIYSETEKIGTIIYLDESFIDFSSNGDLNSFSKELELYPRIVILKSMSKTFGIGGIRLGYAATANIKLLKKLKSKMPIWNINGFAEEFIMNLSQYSTQYEESCKKVRRDTDKLISALQKIEYLKVFDSESNFILCKIKNKIMTAEELAINLLNDHQIYIKECSGKAMKDSEYYIRVSSRIELENEQLVKAIKSVFSKYYTENLVFN